MFWVLIYIATNFLAPIPLISLGIIDFSFRFPPKSTNSSRRISQNSASRKKPALRPAKAGPSPGSQRHRSRPHPPAPSPQLVPTSSSPPPQLAQTPPVRSRRATPAWPSRRPPLAPPRAAKRPHTHRHHTPASAQHRADLLHLRASLPSSAGPRPGPRLRSTKGIA
jgi:hypothetical protein